MQQASLEANKTSNEVILLADTGSGKTLAFLLPVTQLLQKKSVTQALIIVPSRELAIQIESVFKNNIAGFGGIRYLPFQSFLQPLCHEKFLHTHLL